MLKEFVKLIIGYSGLSPEQVKIIEAVDNCKIISEYQCDIIIEILNKPLTTVKHRKAILNILKGTYYVAKLPGKRVKKDDDI